ncbi:hypothetical protein SAMN05444161_8264 [Rhizobiales bacterium GAS191]|jgi:hypothetical protein|nr:hypothetical protein SAMN05519103_06364 [Rhizobiales bacterium GAS113]SEF09395.1 hypothetical protein SAMN05444161_8264 [Rhizobiales bacterium GAS191]
MSRQEKAQPASPTAKPLISLATPAGFEPATNSLEGFGGSNDFNANSDKFVICAGIENIGGFPIVRMPATGVPGRTHSAFSNGRGECRREVVCPAAPARRTERVEFGLVRTPELAQAWARREVAVLNGVLPFLEYLDWACGRGLAPFERARARS